jgi:hypothetical protein
VASAQRPLKGLHFEGPQRHQYRGKSIGDTINAPTACDDCAVDRLNFYRDLRSIGELARCTCEVISDIRFMCYRVSSRATFNRRIW